jgi:large subunit ribosomal protein L4
VARQGTIRAPQFTGGGVVFPPTNRNFEVKVNRKAKRAAFRGALSDHVANGTFGVLNGADFKEPSTRVAADALAAWGKETPIVLVVDEDEENVIKSFRNLERVLVLTADELEVAEVVWARGFLVTETALPLLQARAA